MDHKVGSHLLQGRRHNSVVIALEGMGDEREKERRGKIGGMFISPERQSNPSPSAQAVLYSNKSARVAQLIQKMRK